MIMTKYDCSRTLDYVHELGRICTVYPGCEGCPFGNISCAFVSDITQKHIDIVQKWSDEHPEKPKLTREECKFLQAFRTTADITLGRRVGHLSLANGYSSMELWPEMFRFIKEGETWPLGDLLKLEVEE